MRFAICNETFEGWEHSRICGEVAALGYEGLEIAPFTLAPHISDVSAAERKRLRTAAEDAGLQILGLHWLLAKTEGFQITSSDAGVRRRTSDYLSELARCCRDLGGDRMVFGSPGQRRIPEGATRQQAVAWSVDTFQQLKPVLAETDVKLCLEPLSPNEADFINTCDEALEIIRTLNDPHFVLHLDVKAMSSEATSIPDLIRQHGAAAGHFHANDANRRGPGFGDTDFVPIFKAIEESGYPGWVSVEVFDYSPDPVTIARESLRYMKECSRKS